MSDMEKLLESIDVTISNLNEQIADNLGSENVESVLKDIKNNKRFPSVNLLCLADLMKIDDTGITYLEYLCKNGYSDAIPKKIAKEIINNRQAFSICVKNSYLAWWYLLDDKEREKFEDFLFEKGDSGISLIEYVISSKNESRFIISLIRRHSEVIDYLIKYNSKYILKISHELLETLVTNQNGTFLIEKYIGNKKIVTSLMKYASFESILNYCRSTSKYDLLAYSYSNQLLTNMGNGKTVLEEILDRGIDPKFYDYSFEDKRIFDILFKRNRFDLLYKANTSLLFDLCDDEKTYFELMIEEHKKGKDIHLEKMPFNYKACGPELAAAKLFIMAKNDLIEYVPKIDSEMLLFKGKGNESILELLVMADKVLAEKIVNAAVDRDNPDLVVALEYFQIGHVSASMQIDEVQFASKYIEQSNANYTNGCQSPCENYLEELKNLFLNDGVSDKKIIDLLVTSYRYYTSTNQEYAIKELQQLIAIKKKFPDKFVYVRLNDDEFDEGEVSLSNYSIPTINHETGHTLHYYLANEAIPENYEEVINRSLNNPVLNARVMEYMNHINQVAKQLTDSIDEKEIENYFARLYEGEQRQELDLFLTSSKETMKDELKDSYPEDVLDTILGKVYSVDEFINQKKEIEKAELLSARLDYECDGLGSISDIIDAIYSGKLFNGVFTDKDGKHVHYPGHGINYYQNQELGFIEMIANFSQIIKSKNADTALKWLRYTVGDEVVDMISSFYMKNILNYDLGTNSVGEETNNVR